MIENNIALPWALTVVASFFIVSIGFLCLCGPWEKIVEEAKTIEIEILENESERESVDDEIKGENKSDNTSEPENKYE